MGCFLSKKDSSFRTGSVSAIELDRKETNPEMGIEEKSKKTMIVPEKQNPEKDEENAVKEVFVIKHRNSYDRDGLEKVLADGGLGVRTSSCTKEEVDAILIQCGRLSRNSSGRAASGSVSRSRKGSGSRRSSDFDHCDNGVDSAAIGDDVCDDGDGIVAEKRQHRQRHRQSGGSSHGRTPSRERDQQQRSNSRERSSGRRVSRSPGRRSEIPLDSGRNAANNRPGKMISVPATVSSLVMDKSNNGDGGASGSDTAIKRVSARRNAGEPVVVGPRGACSPRSQSPARVNANVKSSGENQQPSLSHNSSRKAEHSPYRRNPLEEIDTNSLAYRQPSGNKAAKNRSKAIEGEPSNGLNQKPSVGANNRVVAKKIVKETNGQDRKTSSITVTAVVASGAESLKPQTLTRSRSSRQSQDLDLNPETLLNPVNSYNSQLLEDIQSFHQKNTTPVAVPACLTKACSILEAVADLNSTTLSNPSSAFSSGANLGGKKWQEAKVPFVESEVTVSDDIMEPSIQKYVTVRSGSMLGKEDMTEQESSGSNSVTYSDLQHRGFSSSREPSSADSTECWTSRSNTREDDHTPMGQRSESGQEMERSRKGFTGKRRDFNYQNSRIISAIKDARPVPRVAAAPST